MLSQNSRNTRTSSLLQEVEAVASVRIAKTETGSKNVQTKNGERKINGNRGNTLSEMALHFKQNETLTIDISLEVTNNSVMNADSLTGLDLNCLQSCENTLKSGSFSNSCDKVFINTVQ